jgi:hypothetical protein
MANAKRRSSQRDKSLRRYPPAAKALPQSREQKAARSSGSGKGLAKKDREKPKLRLKNGAMADVRLAMYVLEELRVKIDQSPEAFQALLALAHGHPDQADPYQVDGLKRRGWVGKDGHVRQDVADVLLSSLEMTPEGPVLVNPFKLQNKREQRIADKAQEDGDRFWLDIVYGKNRKPPPSRG